MGEQVMADEKSVSITSLITIPALITLAITILRLVGELQHWPSVLFSTAAGGGGAIVGISWLPIIFGPYFAMKLARAGAGPESTGKAIGFALVAAVVFFLAMVWFGATFAHPTFLTLIPLLLVLVSAFIPGIGWKSLGNRLLAYAFAARIPVLIVMFIAMRAGWETHYSRIGAPFANLSFIRQYLYEAFIPQMTMWIAWTVIVGSVLGGVVAAIAARGTQAAPATAS
jgi:hypothetical protein